jgi:hypothetical protein
MEILLIDLNNGAIFNSQDILNSNSIVINYKNESYRFDLYEDSMMYFFNDTESVIGFSYNNTTIPDKTELKIESLKNNSNTRRLREIINMLMKFAESTTDVVYSSLLDIAKFRNGVRASLLTCACDNMLFYEKYGYMYDSIINSRCKNIFKYPISIYSNILNMQLRDYYPYVMLGNTTLGDVICYILKTYEDEDIIYKLNFDSTNIYDNEFVNFLMEIKYNNNIASKIIIYNPLRLKDDDDFTIGDFTIDNDFTIGDDIWEDVSMSKRMS